GQRFEGDPGGVEGVAIRELVLVICEVDDRWLDAAAVGMSIVVSDSMGIEPGPNVPPVNGLVSMMSGQIEVDFARCYCCGLTEECTLTYTETIRER
ncbi:Protein of unknown function (DUF1677, partial [Striga hermonthica]